MANHCNHCGYAGGNRGGFEVVMPEKKTAPRKDIRGAAERDAMFFEYLKERLVRMEQDLQARLYTC